MRSTLYFDWQEFLSERGIEHRAYEGRGWAELGCPFCGDADRGRHLGVRLDPREPGWSCWRDAEHRGRRPEKLVQALLGCSRTEAVGIVENSSRAGGEEQSPEAVESPSPATLAWPDEIKPLTSYVGFQRPFMHHLLSRGFNAPADVAITNGLRYCLSGPFGGRLIIPVNDVDGRLVTWTGRSILLNTVPRYRSLSHRPFPAQPQALRNIKDTLYGAHKLPAGGDSLVVVEGPLDALRMDWFGRGYGAKIVGLFGKNASSTQLATLIHFSDRFHRIIIILDADATAEAWTLAEALRPLCKIPVSTLELPAGVKDPGELNKKQVQELLSR